MLAQGIPNIEVDVKGTAVRCVTPYVS